MGIRKCKNVKGVPTPSKPEGKKFNLGLRKVMKVSYENDLMLLQVISPGGDGPKYSILEANSGVYFIPSVESNPISDKTAFHVPDINSTYTCHFFATDRGEKYLDIVARIEKLGVGEMRNFEIDYSPSGASLIMSDVFWDRVRSGLCE